MKILRSAPGGPPALMTVTTKGSRRPATANVRLVFPEVTIRAGGQTATGGLKVADLKVGLN